MISHVHPTDLSGGCVLTLGSFDGLHLGHNELLVRTRWAANAKGLPAVMVTFDPHPREVLSDAHASLLTTVPERVARAVVAEMDGVSVVAFTKELAALSAAEFLHNVLLDGMNMRGMILGHDHRFGKGRTGDEAFLLDKSKDHGFDVSSVEAVRDAHGVISSSRVRVSLSLGRVEEAARLLGHRYAQVGTVVHGEQRGRLLGYPTANLAPDDHRKVIPGRGVYAVWVHLDDGSVHRGMMNIGVRPTFDTEGLHLEVHLIDFNGDLYGREVRVEYVARIRDEQKFDGVDALVRQLNRDRVRCRAALR